MAHFCSNCGSPIEDNAAFCANCGKAVNGTSNNSTQSSGGQYTNPQYNNTQYNGAQYTVPQYNGAPNNVYGTPMYVSTKVPGRGFGITSLVLGIIGLIISLSCLSMANMASTFMYGVGSYFWGDELVIVFLIYSILSTLAISFASAAKHKGYNNGVTKGGLVTGIIAECFFLLSILMCIA